ncbi:siroheme synthase CysG [Alphaproteobacteria bacterium LSUCC0684]
MNYFPVYMQMNGRQVLFVGSGLITLPKIRLLSKTSADLVLFGSVTDPNLAQLVRDGRLGHHDRSVCPEDCAEAVFAYIGSDDVVERDAAISVFEATNLPYCVIDDKERSRFITPALVDRNPVMIAIGSEGTSPVLARRIKSQIEMLLDHDTGLLAGIMGAFRPEVETLAPGTARRQFWGEFLDRVVPSIRSKSTAQGSTAWAAVYEKGLRDLLGKHLHAGKSDGETLHIHPVQFVGAGPGDPDLLTRKAIKAMDDADIVLHDRLVPGPVLELCRREAEIVEVGKTGFGPSWTQDDINALIIEKARAGHRVVRLKSGDAGIFGRLDEEIDALHVAGLAFEIIPGITAAAAAAADMGVSLTRRGRNQAVHLITGHDREGFADQDWRRLAKPGSVAAIYMGMRALPYIRSRLMMQGAHPATPVTIGQSVGHAGEKWLATTLAAMVEDSADQGLKGPAVVLYGLEPHASRLEQIMPVSGPEMHDSVELREIG